MLKSLSSMEKKLPWGTISGVLGLIGILFGIYAFAYEKKPSVNFEIINESNILDLKNPVNNLSILFQGQDIQKNNQNLKLISVKVINSGETNILDSYFDPLTPLGITVKDGVIVETRITSASSEYLKQRTIIKQIDESSLVFNRFMFDKKSFFTANLFILHDKKIQPEIMPTGKIAGVGAFQTYYNGQKATQNWWNEIFSGGSIVIIVRYFVYVISSILILFFILWVMYLFGNARDSNKQKHKDGVISKIELFLAKKRTDEVDAEIIVRCFKKKGISGLNELKSLIGNSMVIKHLVELQATQKAIIAEIGQSQKSAIHSRVAPYEELVYGLSIRPIFDINSINLLQKSEIYANARHGSDNQNLVEIIDELVLYIAENLEDEKVQMFDSASSLSVNYHFN